MPMNLSAALTLHIPEVDTLLQYSFDLITVISSSGVITYQSPSSERILGYFPEEMVGASVFNFLATEERDRVRVLWASAVDNPQLCVFETAWEHKLDFPVYLECCLRRVPNTDDGSWIINAHDITERLAMQIVLDERNQVIERSSIKLEELLEQHTADLNAEKTRIEAILNNSSDAIVLANANGRISQTNASFDQLFDLRPDEIFDQPLILTIAPHQWAEFSDALKRVNETGQRTHLDVRACRADGSCFDADIAIARLPDGFGGDIVCSLRDITDRKQMENSLRTNERRFRGLFENNNDAVFIISLDNEILAVNTRAVNMLRYSFDEIIGSSADRFTICETDNCSRDALFPDLTCGAVPIYERTFRRADGELIETEVNVALVCDDAGHPMHIQSIVRDISERKHIENELRESLAREQELGNLKMRFVSIVSHEFRTPLATIQAASDVLRYYSGKMTPEQIDVRFDKIQSTVKHMVSLLEDVLTLGQVQSNRLTANLTTVNLNDFCQIVLDDIRGSSKYSKTEILYACTNPEIEVEADERLLRQVITNLVSNACKYSPSGSPASVLISKSGNSVIINFSDKGIGIPEEDQVRLFEAFYRASNTGAIAGSGLGLAITKHAVELHRGTIAVTSTVGKGTTFTVTLPIRIH